MREAELAFRALSARSPPKPQSLLHEASLQQPGAYPKERASPPEPSGSFPADPMTLPRASATKFLTSYYLSLSEIRDSLKKWHAELKMIADQVSATAGVATVLGLLSIDSFVEVTIVPSSICRPSYTPPLGDSHNAG